MKKAKKMALGGAALGAAKAYAAGKATPMLQKAKQAAAPTQFMSNALRGLPMKPSAPDAGAARAFADMQKQKAGMMGIGSQMAKNPQMNTSKMGDVRKSMAGLGAAVAGKMLGKKAGGSVGSASKRADGIAQKGKTKGKII
jgi:hypothetical protein